MKRIILSPFLRVRLATLAMLISLFAIPGAVQTARSQSVTKLDLDRGYVMLKAIKESLKDGYYDPAFHGMDIDARFKAAEQKMKEAKSNGQIFGIIAQVLSELKDSHTYFIPPGRNNQVEYGWQMHAIGDKCYVVAVKPGSDAEAKGLKPGDEVLQVDNYAPTRDNLWVLNYLYHSLRPQGGMRLVVQSPGGSARQLDVAAEVKPGRKSVDLTDSFEVGDFIRKLEDQSRLNTHRYYEAGNDATIWKMPEFDLEESKVDEIMGRVKRRKALILDLRGNGGGYEVTLLRLLGHFFDHDVKVGDIKRRKETKPIIAKTRGKDAFQGQLIVLIDSKSGSAAELFARVVQIEKRGTVIGDRSAGAVMRAKMYSKQVGLDIVVPYEYSVTDADIAMTDGKSLESVGVTPDELLLPTATDLAGQRDPVLARAAALVGINLDTQKAGTLFPIEWKKE